MPALLYAAKAARAPYMTPSGPEALDATVTPTGTRYGLVTQASAVIDDTRYSNRNGAEPVHSVVTAEYTIDVPPWDAMAVAHPMAAADGSFDTPVEVVTAMLNVTGLSAGRHTLYVWGQDAAGHWGVVSAVFITVSEPAPWGFVVYLPMAMRE